MRGWSWTHRIGDARTGSLSSNRPAPPIPTATNMSLPRVLRPLAPTGRNISGTILKPSFDKALCEGLNVLVWHALSSVHRMKQAFRVQQYFAGTHLNPKVTWWDKSAPFFSYINRCQWMLQQGNFDADVLYYYGDHVPNFAQLKKSDPAHILPGYDYDVITEEALIETGPGSRMVELSCRTRLSYRVLVLPESATFIALPALKNKENWYRPAQRSSGQSQCKVKRAGKFCDGGCGSDQAGGPAMGAGETGRGSVSLQIKLRGTYCWATE